MYSLSPSSMESKAEMSTEFDTGNKLILKLLKYNSLIILNETLPKDRLFKGHLMFNESISKRDFVFVFVLFVLGVVSRFIG